MVTIQPVKMLTTGGWPGCFCLEFFGENGSWQNLACLFPKNMAQLAVFFFSDRKMGKWCEQVGWRTPSWLASCTYRLVTWGCTWTPPPTNWAAIREKTQNWPSGPVVGANVFIRQKTAKRTEEPSVPMPHDILMIFPWYFQDISVIFPWYFRDISAIFPWYFRYPKSPYPNDFWPSWRLQWPPSDPARSRPRFSTLWMVVSVMRHGVELSKDGIFHGTRQWKWDYHLVMTNIAMERSTIFNR